MYAELTAHNREDVRLQNSNTGVLGHRVTVSQSACQLSSGIYSRMSSTRQSKISHRVFRVVVVMALPCFMRWMVLNPPLLENQVIFCDPFFQKCLIKRTVTDQCSHPA